MEYKIYSKIIISNKQKVSQVPRIRLLVIILEYIRLTDTKTWQFSSVKLLHNKVLYFSYNKFITPRKNATTYRKSN